MKDFFSHRARPGRSGLLQHCGGLTLVELVVSIVIISIALSMVALTVSSGISRSSDTLLETRVVALARSYMAEILGKRFDENTPPGGLPPCNSVAGLSCSSVLGPEAGESRADFDDVDDYHGFSEGAGTDEPQLHDMDGRVREGYDNFRIEISVRYLETIPEGAEAGLGEPHQQLGSSDAKLITLYITPGNSSEPRVFTAYKVNF